jgi:6-phosphogluconate dehydrogenase
VAVYNRTTAKVDAFINGRAQGKKLHRRHSLEELVRLLKRPRKVMIMVKAGQVLEPGDIIIDGGNSHFEDTIRRTKYVEARACSTSAPASPAARRARCSAVSIMPGGSAAGLAAVKPIFQAIAAKVGPTTASPAATGSARTAPATT